MKIKGTGGPVLPQYTGKKVSRDKGESSEFAKIMKEVTRGSTAPATPPTSVVMLDTEAPRAGKGMVVNELKGMVELLDLYVERLGRGTFKPWELKPLLSHMEGRISHLKEILNSSPMPQKLVDILNDLEVTVAVESAKLERGDYW